MGPATNKRSDAGAIQLPSGESSLYGQFCPIAMASELLATRWTLVVLAEMLQGSTRFNDIRRGAPRMSTALLAKRLRELERAGIIRREAGEYRLTASGQDLAPVVQGIGRWGLRWVDSDCSLANLDVRLLMWNLRRNLRPEPMPDRRVVVEFNYPELPAAAARYWLVIAPGQPVDLCVIDPGHDVDLLVTADLRAMTSAWMGMSELTAELRDRRIELSGDERLSASFTRWIGRCSLASSA